jgi:hypothetical protein
MDAELQAVAAKLLVTIHVLAGYPVPDRAPPVALVPHQELASLTCLGNCNVRGAYLPGRGVLLSDELDPVHDDQARSVLLHELIHAAQDAAGRYAERPPCERYLLREQEAYAVENRYLERRGLPADSGLMLMLQTWSFAGCEAAAAQAVR